MQISAIAGGGGTGSLEAIYASFRNIANGGASSPTTLVEGDVVAFAVTGQTMVTGTTLVVGQDVVVSGVASVAVAGVVRGRDVPHGEFAQIQVYGHHPNIKASGAISAGATLLGAATGNVAVGAAGDDPSARVGLCLTAAASSRCAGILKCL